MRENYYNSYDLLVKEKFAKLQKITALTMLLLAGIAFGYFVFWLGAISDEIFFEYGRPYFEPLAKFLNLGSTDVGIYINTSIISLCAIIPTFFAQIILNKTEETILNEYRLKEEKKRLKEQQEAQKNYLHRFDSIQNYSICLSVDYESKKEISSQNKTTLNKAVYSKLATTISMVEPKARIIQNDVMIISSSDFSKYDTVYDSILNELSNISSNLEKKFDYKVIPSMTTDAFSNMANENNIRKQHFEIQTFNFKNRALSTATFANKYKHLKHNKYAGVPIGEYAYFGNDKMGTYELNVIHKNLTKTLSQI